MLEGELRSPAFSHTFGPFFGQNGHFLDKLFAMSRIRLSRDLSYLLKKMHFVDVFLEQILSDVNFVP